MILNESTATENIKCFVRCRPLSTEESELKADCLKIANEDKTILLKSDESKQYNYDLIFKGSCSQTDIFKTVGYPMVKSFLEGYNGTIFCYGQTGSGKTYTMFGPMNKLFEKNDKEHGLIPNVFNFVFNEQSEVLNIIKNSIHDTNGQISYTLSCSCIEIYQENIIDLLNNLSTEQKLTIRDDSKKGMYIENLTEIKIDSANSTKEAILFGLKNRHVASTRMNSESSRSHLIFTLFLNTIYETEGGNTVSRLSRLHFVDLAGSERQKDTSTAGERLKEAGGINKSLSILGNVINALIEFSEGKTKYIPFRDSKLTYFLKDSLGGNSKTIIIGNISQSFIQLNETTSTLKFLQRAKMIKNKLLIIENVENNEKRLEIENKKMSRDINALKGEIVSMKEVIQNLREELEKSKENPSKEVMEEYISKMNDNKGKQELFQKIDKLLKFENNVKEQFKFLEMNSISALEQFLIDKESYETNFTNITQMIDQTIIQEFKNSSSLDDKIKIFNLLSQNKKYKQELDAYKSMVKYFINQNNTEEAKNNIANTLIKDMVETNLKLIDFLKNNLDGSSDYLIIKKMDFERVKFNLDDLKLKEEEYKGAIDKLEGENYLLQLELKNNFNNIDENIGYNCNQIDNQNFVNNLKLRNSLTTSNFSGFTSTNKISTIKLNEDIDDIINNFNTNCIAIEDILNKYQYIYDLYYKKWTDAIIFKEKYYSLLDNIFSIFSSNEKNKTFDNAIHVMKEAQEVVDLNIIFVNSNYYKDKKLKINK